MDWAIALALVGSGIAIFNFLDGLLTRSIRSRATDMRIEQDFSSFFVRLNNLESEVKLVKADLSRLNAALDLLEGWKLSKLDSDIEL